ncbi:MAG: hypothetical protein EA379_09290 [Phycisphaerales bacterium]|nr:MAG: hypothetical protein EA379_09290 [Phycisphaerales bacterium]
MSPARLRRAACIAASALALAIAGCAGDSRRNALALYDVDAFAFADDLMSPAVRGGSNGLEVVWFIAFDEQQDVANALAPYVHQPLPIDEATKARWESNGVRLVRVPLDDFNTIASTLEVSGLRQRQWMGWALDWREAFRGRSLNRGAAFLLDGVRTNSPGGSTRFVARSWTTPTLDGPRIRLELAAQLEPWGARRADARNMYENSLGAGAEVELTDELTIGEVFSSLTLDVAFEPGYAYVLTAETPGVVWGEQPTTDDGSGEPVVAEPYGPHVALPLTIGEAMLTNQPVASHERPARVILGLIPRAPERAVVLP